VLAQLQADVERSAVSVAQTRAQRDAELDSAVSAHEFARRKQARTESLYQANFISSQVRDEARTEADLAALKLKQAQEQRKQAQRELDFARSQLAQRTIKSPLSGVVIERYMARGERAEERPILRLASLDPLKVEVVMPVTEFEKVRVGTAASVELQLPSAPQRTAKVTHVDRVMDAASNTFRVRLALPNPKFDLPAGVHCKVAFGAQANDKTSNLRRAPLAATKPASSSSVSTLENKSPGSRDERSSQNTPKQAGSRPTTFKLSRSLDRAWFSAQSHTNLAARGD
jgi:RND family efflux transporter MFP subunit